MWFHLPPGLTISIACTFPQNNIPIYSCLFFSLSRALVVWCANCYASVSWAERWQNLIPRERKSITMFWATSGGFGGQTAKLLCFLISEFHQGNRTNMSMKCRRGHVEFLMKRGLFWRIATASESVRLLWLHSPNNKFWCTRSILEVFILEERSLFCVPATSDMKMQASLQRIRVRHESHYLHEHTVIVRQSSTEKCNYATFNSQRAAVELGRQLQMLSLHELYRKIICIVQLHHKIQSIL